MNRWYVVHTHPHAEDKAAHHLLHQGYAVFLPRYRKTRRHARKVETIEAALFPRYLFVGMDIEQTRWRAIRSTFGVRDLVCRNERPAPVPEGVVEDIAARCDSGGIIELPTPTFRTGEKIAVTEGPLTDQIGMFLAMNDEQRVVLLLNMLGREVRITLPLTSVRAASA